MQRRSSHFFQTSYVRNRNISAKRIGIETFTKSSLFDRNIHSWFFLRARSIAEVIIRDGSRETEWYRGHLGGSKYLFFKSSAEFLLDQGVLVIRVGALFALPDSLVPSWKSWIRHWAVINTLNSTILVRTKEVLTLSLPKTKISVSRCCLLVAKDGNLRLAVFHFTFKKEKCVFFAPLSVWH